MRKSQRQPSKPKFRAQWPSRLLQNRLRCQLAEVYWSHLGTWRSGTSWQGTMLVLSGRTASLRSDEDTDLYRIDRSGSILLEMSWLGSCATRSTTRKIFWSRLWSALVIAIWSSMLSETALLILLLSMFRAANIMQAHTMIFQSTFRRTAFSSRQLQRKRGSNADQFSHSRCIWRLLSSSTLSLSQMFGCVATRAWLVYSIMISVKWHWGTNPG